MTAGEITIAPGTVRRVSCETALDDYDVTLDPGTYPLRYTTIDFRPCEPAGAYWVLAAIPCTRVRDGVRIGKAGERGIYHLQTWPYALERMVAS